jgi:membrane protein DedA with SNARE-associated domain
VVAGAFLSKGGRISAFSVFLVTWSMNVASAAAVYFAARRVGRPFFQGPVGRRLLNPRAFERIEMWYGKYGAWGILLSRFVPAARAVVPPFAGVAGLSPLRTLIPLTVASGVWYGALTWAAVTLINEVDDVARFMASVNRTALLALGAVLAVAVGFLVLRWWKKRRAKA